MALTNATCDQCGPAVRGRFIVSLPSGRWLVYCNHHLNLHREALEAQGAYIAEADEIVV